uniref:Uncharacterized protein n=1 Tax=Rhizophora mucronata TaxID=61149 RepID=A0A2P2P1C2_RHIMU
MISMSVPMVVVSALQTCARVELLKESKLQYPRRVTRRLFILEMAVVITAPA